MKILIAVYLVLLPLLTMGQEEDRGLNGTNISEKHSCFVPGQCQEYSVNFKRTDDVDLCHKFCGQTEDCSWWSFEPSQNLCILFANCTESGAPDTVACEACISGEKLCPSRECHGAFKCKGIFIDSFEIAHLEDCLGACSDNSECMWFTLEKTHDHCILYEDCEVQMECETCASGERQCSAGYHGPTSSPVYPETETETQCMEIEEHCYTDEECCGDNYCNGSYLCEAPTQCMGIGEHCYTDEECCCDNYCNIMYACEAPSDQGYGLVTSGHDCCRWITTEEECKEATSEAHHIYLGELALPDAARGCITFKQEMGIYSAFNTNQTDIDCGNKIQGVSADCVCKGKGMTALPKGDQNVAIPAPQEQETETETQCTEIEEPCTTDEECCGDNYCNGYCVAPTTRPTCYDASMSTCSKKCRLEKQCNKKSFCKNNCHKTCGLC